MEHRREDGDGFQDALYAIRIRTVCMSERDALKLFECLGWGHWFQLARGWGVKLEPCFQGFLMQKRFLRMLRMWR
jgi:hypothetical protein